MSVLELARRPPGWLRAVLASLLIAFAINAVAHVSHWHETAAPSAVHSLACGYCASFGALADAPRHVASLPPATCIGHLPQCPAEIVRVDGLKTSARPRAPPI